MADWWVSLIFILVYLAVFHFWRFRPAPFSILVSGGIGVGILAFLQIHAFRKQYFTSFADGLGHVILISDLVAEVRLIALMGRAGNHPGYSFYWFAVAFAAIVGAYRWFRLYGHAPKSSKNTDRKLLP